ncbi:MAG: glycoside hydrolase family 3 C-terminal domain-containing protein [Muribaculaceae bacterium]|nr:glycoside hydrolase family 3 C-terminal domain-containing protein [Muribaculaceae bacterium]
MLFPHTISLVLRRVPVVLMLWLVAMTAASSSLPPYRDASLPVETRIDDLLSRMTAEEKVGQLVCLMGWDSYVVQSYSVATSAAFREQMRTRHVGSYWAVMRADPWTRRSLTNGLNPALAAHAANAMQRFATDSTRLGIPLLLAEEAPHGHMAIVATVMPTGLGMAATWSPQLMQQAGAVIAREVRLQGAHLSYGPVLDLCRDPRWSRTEETLGEDPCLSGTLGAALVRGLGSGHMDEPLATAATLKHFIAYGASEGGLNGARAMVTPRELKQQFLPPFRQAIDAGARAVMTAYNTIDGVPCTSHRHLLADVLREEWGFGQGLVMSDLYSIDVIHNTHHAAASKLDAAIAALKAGVDVDLGGNCYALLVEAVNDGRVSRDALNHAVARVLRLKFEMGLFENPFVSPTAAQTGVNDSAAVATARQMAQASITLLKNNGVLPLSTDMKVAVVGPNAHNVYNQLGDYTAPQREGKVITVLNGIQRRLPDGHCTYAKGCAVRDNAASNIAAAIQAAHQADVVVAVVGGSSARDFRTSYEQTGAASAEQAVVSDIECGEGFDRATLALLGRQEELLEALRLTGKPLVVVYIEGRPLDKRWADAHADALLTAYYPGEQGGNAIADVLFGDYNPAGRLPVSVPRSTGQLPVYYNRPASGAHDYVEMPATPLYPFGYGLSYTTFEYANLRVTPAADGGYDASFSLTNNGSRQGDEVVQLYVRHHTSSVVQPERQLKAFDRVTLAPEQTRQVTLHLDHEALAIVDAQMQWTVEPGMVDILVGASSTDIRLTHTLNVK